MPRFTIDRFEGTGWAVLEDERGRSFDVPRGWLPAGAREGDVLDGFPANDASGGATSTLRFELNPAARDERLADAHRLRTQLPKGPKGDVSL